MSQQPNKSLLVIAGKTLIGIAGALAANNNEAMETLVITGLTQAYELGKTENKVTQPRYEYTEVEVRSVISHVRAAERRKMIKKGWELATHAIHDDTHYYTFRRPIKG
tara:strand:- start:147 stop:470 length:324 start_codon:yes stop_codon:yes gene_type:complete